MTLPTVGEAWRGVRARFREAGLPTADLDARFLAEGAFHLSTASLLAHDAELAEPSTVTRLTQFAERRLGGEPVARILGEWEFWSLPFGLNAATLVPRPETELLVELGLAAIRGTGSPKILDLGTGSGAIIISLLHERLEAVGVATDLSHEALAMAGANAKRNGVASRLTLRQGSWWEAVNESGGFDLIVSNPPYIDSGDIAGLSPEVRDHDPPLALDGGPDGLAPYREIAARAAGHLRSGGRLLVEIGSTQGPAVQAIFAAAGLGGVAVHRDLAGLDRVVAATHL